MFVIDIQSKCVILGTNFGLKRYPFEMKQIIFIFIAFNFYAFPLIAQELVCQREAELVPGMYDVEGTAILEQYSNGVVYLRLDQQFSTAQGPDVQIFLGNHATDVSDALYVANIGIGEDGLNHFEGEIEFILPMNFSLDEYDFVIFRCVQYNLHWGGGSFGLNSCDLQIGCSPTSIFTSMMETEVTICTEDGVPDNIVFFNSQGAIPGNNFQYVITDETDQVLVILDTNNYDFEATDSKNNFVYGIAYEGDLTLNVGDLITDANSTDCLVLSDIDSTLFINKDGCSDIFECLNTIVATTMWVSEISVCPGDGRPDDVILLNNAMYPAGPHYVFVITDDQNNIIEVVYSEAYNFDDSGEETNHVHGISYDGELSYNNGDHISTMTASECLILSNQETYLTVLKDGCDQFDCPSTIVATTAWADKVEICATDGIPDSIPLLNTAAIPAGEKYAYIIADATNNILLVILDGIFDFEGSGIENNHIFGVSYSGQLDFNLGEHVSTVTASNCATVSSTDIYLTVAKNGCPPYDCVESNISLKGGAMDISICTGDGESDIIELENDLEETNFDHYSFVVTDSDDDILRILMDNQADFESTGMQENRIYGISYDGTLEYSIGTNISDLDASECLILSDVGNFITVSKDGCVFTCEENFVETNEEETDISICISDENADIITFTNSLDLVDSDHYSYLITNESNVIMLILDEASYDFSGSESITQRVFGIQYEIEHGLQVGFTILENNAEGCHSISSNYIEVRKDLCDPIFECLDSSVSDVNGETEIDICPNDGNPDLVQFTNNINEEAGDHYQYLLTDNNNRIEELINGNEYDFEGSSLEENRVFGISYDGTLNFDLGDHISDITADGCSILSNPNLFLSITKNACSLASGSIVGRVLDIRNRPIEGVELRLNNQANTFTDENGNYSFTDLEPNENYLISLRKEEPYEDGVSAIDLINIQKHILNVQLFDSPYQYISADVNNSQSITALDLIEIQKLILQISSSFSKVNSWRFALEAEEHNVDEPYIFDEELEVTMNGNFGQEVNFIGIKMGDVDASSNN